MLTEDQLRQIMPNLPAAKAALLLPHVNRAMAEYGINSMQRVAAFVAQLAHESGEFRWMEEIWGPTAAQRRYEPVSDLVEAARQHRAGRRQCASRAADPSSSPAVPTTSASVDCSASTWSQHRSAPPSLRSRFGWPRCTGPIAVSTSSQTQQNFREITRRINGGFNGLADRQKYFERAKAVLATGPAAALRKAAARIRAGARAPARKVPAEPLTRGVEVIREFTAPTKRARKTTRECGRPPAGRPSARTRPPREPTGTTP